MSVKLLVTPTSTSVRSVFRWMGVLLTSLLAGIMAGAIVFAPLHLPVLPAVAVTFLATLLYIALWSHQGRVAARGARAKGRRWAWGLALAPLLFVLGTGGLALFQLYAAGQFPPITQDRVSNFDRLTRAIAAAYPYFDEKGIDWAAMTASARPQIESVQNDDDYFSTIATLLAGLNDGHTSLIWPYPEITPLGQLAAIEGQTVVVMVGPTASAAGLAPGDVVLAIDGETVEDAIDSLPPQLRYGSTAWSRHEFALSNLLAVRAPAAALGVTFQNAEGEVHTVELRPDLFPTDTPPAQPAVPLVVGNRLPSGIGYIHLGRNFGNRSGHDMVAGFDAALAGLMDAPALILDLRDNGGGNSLLANQIAGRFLTDPFVYGREHYRQRLPTRLWWSWGDRHIEPRPPFYTAPVVLLVDATTSSSAEEFVVSLVDSGRAQSVGRQTAGSTGNPIEFQLPGDGIARFSTGDLRRIDGTPIEGAGVTPDVVVDWTLDDVRHGLDPDLAAAVALLRPQIIGQQTGFCTSVDC